MPFIVRSNKTNTEHHMLQPHIFFRVSPEDIAASRAASMLS
ncbi:hypothetical protein APHCRT_0235 [Anaplasma phagocytophilum str. CRT53-1]|uniref:Uncharacterized protein n=1 Tax=Anaplasma phagocytophilum str. CRT53-1 TaxID=1359157 RepID=A0A0F3Q685_ANAPH|nr:hypothetical protein APHCRT_0245 [Anaplasma phagocytophilum str. CRT53-1]KJV88038.1 hypothetical protein APHCRT_0235 [Anaplasma phagocytophilum str. CRT53-1]